jgi:hypothetical protein
MFVKSTGLAVVAASIAAIQTINVAGVESIAVEVKNSGANPLDAFEVVGKITPHSSEITLASLAANYTGPAYPIVRASASPVTLAAGASMWMVIDVAPFSEVQFKASSSGGDTTLDLHASVKNPR